MKAKSNSKATQNKTPVTPYIPNKYDIMNHVLNAQYNTNTISYPELFLQKDIGVIDRKGKTNLWT